tara:strand:+ start:365 stop:556 length:192 start_codon:yes stop_codon:yes gene_type:complete
MEDTDSKNKWMSIGDIMDMWSISRSTFDSLAKNDKTFPKPTNIGPRTKRWKMSEIIQWTNKEA